MNRPRLVDLRFGLYVFGCALDVVSSQVAKFGKAMAAIEDAGLDIEEPDEKDPHDIRET
jgi:hypothetical protein